MRTPYYSDPAFDRADSSCNDVEHDLTCPGDCVQCETQSFAGADKSCDGCSRLVDELTTVVVSGCEGDFCARCRNAEEEPTEIWRVRASALHNDVRVACNTPEYLGDTASQMFASRAAAERAAQRLRDDVAEFDLPPSTQYYVSREG